MSGIRAPRPSTVVDDGLVGVQVEDEAERARPVGCGQRQRLPAADGQPQRRVLELRLRRRQHRGQLPEHLRVGVQRVAGRAPPLVVRQLHRRDASALDAAPPRRYRHGRRLCRSRRTSTSSPPAETPRAPLCARPSVSADRAARRGLPTDQEVPVVSRTPSVPDDWFVGFHQGLAARFWRAAGAAMLDGRSRARAARARPAAGRGGPRRPVRRRADRARARPRRPSRDRRRHRARRGRARDRRRSGGGRRRALPRRRPARAAGDGPVRRRRQLGQQLRLPHAGGQRAVARRDARRAPARRPACARVAQRRRDVPARRRRRARGARVRRRAHARRQPLRRDREPRRERRRVHRRGRARRARPARAPRPHVRRGRADAARGRVRDVALSDGEGPFTLGSPRLVAVAIA